MLSFALDLQECFFLDGLLFYRADTHTETTLQVLLTQIVIVSILSRSRKKRERVEKVVLYDALSFPQC